MKNSVAVLALLYSFGALAQNKAPVAPAGYEIRVTLKPYKNQYVYLGHYYGKQLPIIDSVKLNEQSTGVFRGPRKLGGGIYLIGYPDKAHSFELLIDKNQKFSVAADTAQPQKLVFTQSPENDAFKAYQEAMNNWGRANDALLAKRRGSSAQDSLALTAQINNINEQVRKYRQDLMAKDPNGLLTALLQAMREPEVPQNDPAAKTDSAWAYKYFKKHYWDGVSFMDDRLARTPFFESRVDKYFEQLVYPAADSVIKEIDWMMSYANVKEDMQKFLLLKFINRYYNQKYMWEDAVFVHLFEKYLAQKSYPWMADKGRKMITDRAYSLMANLMGSPAAEVELPDSSGSTRTLYATEAPFTLVTIWDPTCGHCKETLPRIDSFYRNKWKGYGLKIFALAKETDGKRTDWTSFINKHRLDWTHVYYSKEADEARIKRGVPGYSQLYDVQSFPTLYLLDKDKRIIAKKVSLDQVDEILQYKLKNN